MQRWTAKARFRYKPVISFDRRKAALLDWVETNLEPSAFLDAEDEVGISIKRGARIRIGRSSVVLENNGALADGFESLEPMLGGLCETMEPKGIRFESASFAWTAEYPGIEYEDATSRLARSVTGVGTLPSGLRAQDVASLVDFVSERFSVQIEYGVVSPDELRERLERNKIGRINDRPPGQIHSKVFDGLPEVMLFIDTYVHSARRTPIVGQSGIMETVATFESVAKEVAELVTATAIKKETTP